MLSAKARAHANRNCLLEPSPIKGTRRRRLIQFAITPRSPSIHLEVEPSGTTNLILALKMSTPTFLWDFEF
ncbi:hypothetical protein CEXT_95431 [Caerostris extrusa]|uniref:Uncharacterized protein n=1 Tax=Caerostris extrusa TaxID=172846 RepID=A0AAV4UVG8_CAEEX|nr:hypothetical protein CEXT_95431 [Caerostris extrusa]